MELKNENNILNTQALEFPITGVGNETITNVQFGTYTVTWDSLIGYDTPDPVTIELNTTGSTITFTGNYTKNIDIVAVHADLPYISAYPWSSSGFGTKYSDPTALPGTGNNVTFSPDGNNIIAAHWGSPYISAYSWSSGFGTKYSNPTELPVAGNAVAIH